MHQFLFFDVEHLKCLHFHFSHIMYSELLITWYQYQFFNGLRCHISGQYFALLITRYWYWFFSGWSLLSNGRKISDSKQIDYFSMGDIKILIWLQRYLPHKHSRYLSVSHTNTVIICVMFACFAYSQMVSEDVLNFVSLHAQYPYHVNLNTCF